MSQTSRPERPQPVRLRVLGLLCTLLLTVMSTAQAAHVHGRWLPHQGPELSAPSAGQATASQDVCPLCVAMHSASPAHAAVPSSLAVVSQLRVALPAVRPVVSLWHFEQFSRPPPSSLL